MIVHLHAILGTRWSAIAGYLPRRIDNEIKNYWNTHLKKRLLQMGINPVTHKSTAIAEADDLDSILPSLPRPVMSSALSHLSQWECPRAEADARLARQSTLTQTNFNAVNPKAAHDVSTSFMNSWNAQVAVTLRASFGVVDFDKTSTYPVNLEKFTHEWESWHHTPKSLKLGFPASGSPINFTSSSSTSEVMSPRYITDSRNLHFAVVGADRRAPPIVAPMQHRQNQHVLRI